MRLQLTGASLALALALAIAASPRTGRADSYLDAHVVYFDETGLNDTLRVRVISPSAEGSVDLGDHLTARAGYSADVVSGATVKVVDVSTSATEFSDTRHSFTGGLTARRDTLSVSGSYTYGFENDYRSHSITVTARTEIAERNSIFELAYSHNWDGVCNEPNRDVQDAARRIALDSSTGCFAEGNASRVESPLSVDSVQLSYTQNLSAILVTQLVATAQLLHGFQSNPYRSVLSSFIAQEHHPEDRARLAVAGRVNLFLPPLRGALRVLVRGYRDTWDVRSTTLEGAYEQTFGPALRLMGRVRYYRQNAAVFYSDDYGLSPQGQYFTGDRDLAAMTSWIVGARLLVHLTPPEDQTRLLSLFHGLDLALKADLFLFDYSIDPNPIYRFTLAGTPVDMRAVVLSATLSMQF